MEFQSHSEGTLKVMHVETNVYTDQAFPNQPDICVCVILSAKLI